MMGTATQATARTQDQNGYLLVRACPLSSFGIFDYSAAQVGMSGDPDRIVKVFRPEQAVSDPELIESLRNVPLINDHEMLSGFADDSGATAPEEYGIDGVLTGNVQYQKPWLLGDLKIFTRSLQDALQKGKKDLSLGYTCDFLMKPGVYDGQPYEVVQTNMRGNHIALVDEGRIPGARVLDGKRLCFDHLSFKSPIHSNGANMKRIARKVADADTVSQLKAQLKALLPTFEQFLSEEAAEPAHAPAAAAQPVAEAAGADPMAAQPAAAAPAPAAQPVAEAAEPVAAAPAAAPAAPAAAPAGGDMEAFEALAAALQQALAAVQAVIGGAAPAGGEAEGGEPPVPPEEGETSEGDQEGEAPPAETPAAPTNSETSEDEGEEEMADTVEGLEGTAREGATDDEGTAPVGGGQGTAPQGPAAGTHAEAGDAAMQKFYADSAAKGRLYQRLSKVVGAFDHAAMDAKAVAIYGVKKLKLNAPKGQEAVTLDAYLTGIEAAQRNAVEATKARQVAKDSAEKTVVDEYLAGSR